MNTFETFFKTVESLSPWHKRLQELINERRLILDTGGVQNGSTDGNFTSILSTSHFTQLKNIFKILRGDERNLNNLTDAISVSILIEKVANYHAQKKQALKEVPLSSLHQKR